MHPHNPIEAATHANPYPYYAQLLAGPALYFDAGLRMWVASRADVIREVLANAHCTVRPLAEPVPAAIAGSSAGAVFAKLIRMNEGEAHACGKQSIGKALAQLDAADIAARTFKTAARLAAKHELADGAGLSSWVFELPTCVLADLLGVADDEQDEVAACTRRFVQCLSALSTAQELAEASDAAHALMARFESLSAGSGLFGAVCAAAWPDRKALLANVVGLLSQTHEATAGLIGNSIIRLMAQPEPCRPAQAVSQTMRFDPPVQNTRRFVGSATTIAGRRLSAGDVILLVLAADSDPQPAGFGHGRHACPGQDVAASIAASAISYLMSTQRVPQRGTIAWRYRPSLNARLPLFHTLTANET